MGPPLYAGVAPTPFSHFCLSIDPVRLVSTTHPDTREPDLKSHLDQTIRQTNWYFLTIITMSKGGPDDKVGKIEFVAHYFADGQPYELHERSRFKRYKGAWKYLDAKG